MKEFELKNGNRIPALGLGTWKSQPGEVENAIIKAVEIGYRHIDCAAIYGNEVEIGNALKKIFDAGVIKREDLWITSKLWNSSHAPDDVELAIEKTLADLQLGYLDLYLIHWPIVLKQGVQFPENSSDFVALSEMPLADTWTAMEGLVSKKLARNIGVSNFNETHLKEVAKVNKLPISVNQIEAHPYLQQRSLFDYCSQNNILITAYSPLGSPGKAEGSKNENFVFLLEDTEIKNISDTHGVTPAQVILAWGMERGTAVIPKTVHEKRLLENFEASKLKLSEDEMLIISKIDKNHRYVDGAFWTPEGSPYTLDELWG